MPEYILENQSEEMRAKDLIKDKLNIDVNVNINKETGIIKISSENQLSENILNEIEKILREYGFLV